MPHYDAPVAKLAGKFRMPWSRITQLLAALISLTAGYNPAMAQMAEDTLPPFAINIHRTPTQDWPGYGIYLGRGYFLTAAHVAGQAWLTKPRVVIEGREYPTTMVKEGTFEGTDLTLLSVKETLLPMRLALRRMRLCAAVPAPGEDVVTLVPGRIEHSRIFPPQMIPESARRFKTAIADVAQTGNSGAGVFDLRRHCLVGIMSRKISEVRRERLTGKNDSRDIAKYFVPAPEIGAFLPPGVLSAVDQQR